MENRQLATFLTVCRAYVACTLLVFAIGGCTHVEQGLGQGSQQHSGVSDETHDATAEQGGSQSSSARTNVSAIGTKGDAGVAYATLPVGLCWLVKASRAGIGEYKVESLQLAKEVVNSSSGGTAQEKDFAYAKLTLIEPWTSIAPNAPTARIWDCVATVCPVSLSVGETVVLFLDIPATTNKGYYNAGPVWLWQNKDGQGWTNGAIYSKTNMSLDALKASVQTLADDLGASGTCSFDVKPDPSTATNDGPENAPQQDDGPAPTSCVECPDVSDSPSPSDGKK